MKENVGGLDRKMRWILGTAALVTAFTAPLPKGWRISLLAFGATEFLTAGSRYCPMNELLGVDTRKGAIRHAIKTVASLV